VRIVIFGLTISSSWGNGHATLWRGLCNALIRQGHRIVFYEKDVSYYAGARDLHELTGGRLQLYAQWEDIQSSARADVLDADVAIITSYCPDALAATEVILSQTCALRIFYDLDTPVTLARLRAGKSVEYIGAGGLADFDLVLSYTGGSVLTEFEERLGARRVAPLYGHVDPTLHYPEAPRPHYSSSLSYLGTYSADRQVTLDLLFVQPAAMRPGLRFLIGGAQYPDDFPWSPNIYFVRHLPPAEHRAFFCSCRLTLNVTRAAMALAGWCPSGRLFEAAACGAPIISDAWPGIESFFAPGEEVVIADCAADTLAALDMEDSALRAMARRARERTLEEHSSDRRAEELVSLVETWRSAGPMTLAEA
jgi:spore maturation protein CgeB